MGVLRPLGQHDLVASCGSFDAVNYLLPWCSLGDESLRTGSQGTTHRLRVIGKAEYHDHSVAGVGAEREHSLGEGSQLSVGVEQRDIDPSPRSRPNVDFDDLDLGLTGPEEG